MSRADERRWRPRLVALDIDGTVVDFDNQMPDPVRDAGITRVGRRA